MAGFKTITHHTRMYNLGFQKSHAVDWAWRVKWDDGACYELFLRFFGLVGFFGFDDFTVLLDDFGSCCIRKKCAIRTSASAHPPSASQS